MKLTFNINYFTQPGQQLQLLISEDGQGEKQFPLEYLHNGDWIAEVDYFSKAVTYRYRVTDSDGSVIAEEISKHQLYFTHNYSEYQIYDVWNRKNFPENYLNNKILKNKLQSFRPKKLTLLRRHTHLFRIEAPVYNNGWTLVIVGNVPALGEWNLNDAVPMKQTGYGVWEVAVEIADNQRIEYKYGLKDIASGHVFDLESGESRWASPNTEKNILNIQADHYFRFKSYQLYRAAGVAVPVFSLRSENSFGVGEFADLKLLADWAAETKLGIIQTLPINDTTATYKWTDSYPYAPISLYALHPQYISLESLDYALPKDLLKEYQAKKQELDTLESIDYEQVIAQKWKFLRAAFSQNREKILRDRQFKKFLKENESWLLPYAAFCIQRDRYRTPNFNEWRTHKKYIAGKVAPFFAPQNKDYNEAMLHSWVQFQLHKQMVDAVNHAHNLGVSLKGDLPIGIYRYSVEAWTEPELYGMDFQAGAPPDQFTELGQNWGFPTYNWAAMKADGYRWWKSRFHALEQYFDAMRIDHILGFFRIWRMPVSATQGILGYFYPAVPVYSEEFSARHIPFEYQRYCQPFINDQILWDNFGEERDRIADRFMNNHFNGRYSFKDEFKTQRKLTDYFADNPHDWAEEKLINLCANVLFLEEERDGITVFHPRFNLHKTDSYKYLSDWEMQSVYELYVDYFYQRQDGLWRESAMEKLPAILNATDMLICGEDLGLVPACVPSVMDELAITALKVQRMPPGDALWYDPKQAGYMNVVTASSHDSSTLRQWWHEDRALAVNYFKNQLHQYATAPGILEPGLAEIIMKQHLYNEAMLAIFPLQEYFATDQTLVNPDENAERINDPAVFPHYWRYRMHINLEDLKNQKEFNSKIASWVEDSGRK